MSLDINQLETLSFVSKFASFNRAAQQQHITQSAVSQRIRCLEDSVGQPLLIRSSPPRLTKLGQKCVAAFEQIQALTDDLISEDLKNFHEISISLGCNSESMEIWFDNCLIELSKKFKVLFNISIEDQDITHDLIKNLSVLGCVSSEPGPIQGCKTILLGSMRYKCVAHKKFIDKHRLSKVDKNKLLALPTMIYGPNDKIHDQFLSDLFKGSIIPPYRAHSIPSLKSITKYVDAAAAYAILPEPLIAKGLENEKYIDLYPTYYKDIPLHWHIVQTEIPLLNIVTEKVVSESGKFLVK